MPELTQCPQCQAQANVQEEQSGQTVQCPVCGEFFTAAILKIAAPHYGPRPFPKSASRGVTTNLRRAAGATVPDRAISTRTTTTAAGVSHAPRL